MARDRNVDLVEPPGVPRGPGAASRGMSAVLPRGGDEGAIDVNGTKCDHPRQILVARARRVGGDETVRDVAQREVATPRLCAQHRESGLRVDLVQGHQNTHRLGDPAVARQGHLKVRRRIIHVWRAVPATAVALWQAVGQAFLHDDGDGALDQQPGDGGIGGAGVMRTPGMHDDPGVVRVAGYRGGQDPRAHGARRDRSRCAQHPRHHRCYIRDYAGAADPVGSLLLLDDVHRARIAERTDAELGEAGEHHHRRLGGGDQVAERNSDVARLMPYSRATAVSSSPEPAR